MLEAIIGLLGTALLGTLGWAVQLSSEVKIVKTEQEGLKELIEAKFDEVNRRLDRIERAMNGALANHD
jgi:hypothetical protein